MASLVKHAISSADIINNCLKRSELSITGARNHSVKRRTLPFSALFILTNARQIIDERGLLQPQLCKSYKRRKVMIYRRIV
jgi:hypothetical protein